jgi:hypothetical protein
VFTYRDVLLNREPPQNIVGVPAVPYILRGNESRTLYRFNSWRPSQNIAQGQPVGIRFVGPNTTDPVYKTAWFGCPLYYLEDDQARDLVAGMTDWFLNQPLEAGP